MSNALFLIYFSIVNGVESLGEVYRGARSPQGQWSQRCFGDRCRVPCWALRPSSGTLSVRAPLRRDCLSGSPGTWSHQRMGLFSFVSRMLTYVAWDLGDCWWMTHSGLSHWVRDLRGSAPGSAHTASICPCGLRLLGFSVPPEITGLFHLAYCWWKIIWGLFGVVVWVACLCGRKKDRRVPAQGPGASTRITFYFNFCVLAILSCKTNRCLQYNTCIKNNNNKNKAWFFVSRSLLVPCLGSNNRTGCGGRIENCHWPSQVRASWRERLCCSASCAGKPGLVPARCATRGGRARHPDMNHPRPHTDAQCVSVTGPATSPCP